MQRPSPLATWLSDAGQVLIGYSGGVDSSLVAVVARRVLGRDRAIAALGISPSLSRVQHEQARDIASAFDLDLLEVPTAEMHDAGYVANAPDRCYHCKRELWTKLEAVARERGIPIILDGTNADDLGDHRPGGRAGREFAVRSPLAELGYSKADVRSEAQALGLPNWDAPAAPCLSSRVMYGLSVTPARLKQVEQGEEILRSIGIEGNARVRHRGSEARIEVEEREFDRIRDCRTPLGQALLALGFDTVTLDLRGYRRGSALSNEELTLETLVTHPLSPAVTGRPSPSPTVPRRLPLSPTVSHRLSPSSSVST